MVTPRAINICFQKNFFLKRLLNLTCFFLNFNTLRLIELLSSVKQPTIPTKPTNLRRSLSEDFESKSPKKIKLDESAAEVEQDVQEEPVVSLVALKPLLSYSGDDSQQQNTQNVQKIPKPPVVSASPANLSKVQIESSNSQLLKATSCPQTPVTNRLCQPILVSTVGTPMSIQKASGLYQIIPIQCKQMNKNEKTIPVFIGQQQVQQGVQRPSTTPSTNVVTMLMRPPIVTVTSPSVLLSPRNPTFQKKQGTDLTNQISEGYPEYFTPPHVLINSGNGKPPANPIIFPKMTPETPSSDPKSVLTAVTRKLMSLHNEESA